MLSCNHQQPTQVRDPANTASQADALPIIQSFLPEPVVQTVGFEIRCFSPSTGSKLPLDFTTFKLPSDAEFAILFGARLADRTPGEVHLHSGAWLSKSNDARKPANVLEEPQDWTVSKSIAIAERTSKSFLMAGRGWTSEFRPVFGEMWMALNRAEFCGATLVANMI